MANANTKKFTVNVKGDRTGEQFYGNFEVKIFLAHRDEMLRDRRKRDLLGTTSPQYADERTMQQAVIFSELTVRVLSAPSWWTESDGGLDLYDDNVVASVYNETMAAEKDALAALKGEGEKAAEQLREHAKEQEPPAGA